MSSLVRVSRLAAVSDDALCCCELDHARARVAAASEDGVLALFDFARTDQPCQVVQQFGGEAVASLAFSPVTHSDLTWTQRGGDTTVNEHVLFAAAARVVTEHDLRMESCEALRRYEFNQDDVNHIVLNRKGTMLAAADDTGDVKVMDVEKCKLHKTLRGGHDNICSAVQFRPHHPWEVMSGGLDCRMLRWDYGSGRVRHSWNMAEAEADGGEGGGQLFNPPMVHSVAVGGADDHLSQRVVAVARGDGAVVVYDVAAAATTRSGGRKGARGGAEGARAGNGARCGGASPSGRPRSVTAQLNGHAASATHVAFGRFSGGRHLVSGGNDARLVLWDWAAAAEAEAVAEAVEDKAEGIAGVDPPGVHTAAHGDKVNWLCTSTDRSHAVFVADTSPQLSVYALAA